MSSCLATFNWLHATFTRVRTIPKMERVALAIVFTKPGPPFAFVIRAQTGSRRRKADLFTVDRSTVVTARGLRVALSGENHALTDFRARGGGARTGEKERERANCHGEYAFGTCSPAKCKKERSGNAGESIQSVRALHRMTEKEKKRIV